MPGKIHVPVSFALDGLDSVTRKLKGATRTLGALGIAAASVGGRFAGKFVLNAIEGSRDLERNLEGLATVFKNSTNQMEDFSEGAYKMGLSLSEAAKASTFIGSVLKQSGFSIEQTADLTEDLVSLGADLALTYGYDVQEALLGMTALFRGEYDPIEKFGVAMKQSEIDAEKLARGLGGLTGAAERFADQQIRVEFLMDRASDAVGAVERQQGNLAVQQNILNASFNNIRDTVALGLLPTLASLTGQMADGLMRVTPQVRDAFDAFETPLRNVGQFVIDYAEPAIVALAEGMEALGYWLGRLTDPTSDLGGSFATVAVSAAVLGDQINETTKGIQVQISFLEFIAAAIKVTNQVISGLIDIFSDTVIWLQEWLPNAWMFFALSAELAMAKVVALFDFLPWTDDLAGAVESAQKQLDDFTSSVNANVASRQAAADVSAQNKMAMVQEEFAAKKLAASLATLPTSSRIEILEAELKDLVKFKAPQEAIDKVQEELKKLLGIKEEGGGGVGDGETVKDFVGEFYDKLADEIKKQSAKLDLEGLGLSEALIESVLNSKGWEKIYDNIVEGGEDAARRIQAAFNLTADGLEELAAIEEARQENLAAINALTAEQTQLQKDLAADIELTTDAYTKFVAATMAVIDSVTALNTYEREIGRFEQQTRADLSRIEDQINDAFDNGYLLEDAKKNLLAYARTELSVLANLQRSRDELLSQRNAAADVIFGVADAVTSAGNLISLLGDVSDKVKEVEVTEVFEDIVKTAGSLEGFKVSLTRNFTDVITETIDKSAQLTNNFQAVIDRTKLFIENLIELRKLGLDPFLFNQLVEAGAEAGGATAQALIDGGADTINEVNALTRELESLGVQLGEETYEVTKDAGERFISGIVDGMDSELFLLEEKAKKAAEVFSNAFATSMAASMEDAFSSILDEIKATFAALMAELERQKNLLGAYGTISPTTTVSGNTSVSTMPIVSTGVPSYSIATTPMPTYEQRPLDFGGSFGFSPTPVAVPVGDYNLQLAVYANNRVGGAQAAEEVVNLLKTYQGSNGSYQLSLTGFGS